MTKFFSLISGKEVHIAPGIKVIPAKEFSTLTTASAILKTAKKEIEELKEKHENEAIEAKEEARQAGFQEGLVSLNKHIHQLDLQLKEIRTEFQEKILPLALTAAKKLIGEELKLHPDRIVDIVIQSLKPITQHRKIVIYVNKNDLEKLEKGKSKIKKIFENLENLSIQERDDIEPGGCMIQTEAGIINAQLENQWLALEAAFATFMKK